MKAARLRMRTRNPRSCSNRFLTTEDLHRYGQFKADGLTLWERVIEQRRLTTRSSLQLLRVARTIADLNGQETVQAEAIADASGTAARISLEITPQALYPDRCRGDPGFSFHTPVA